MKKILGLFAITIPLLAAGVIATNWEPNWETVNSQLVKGGTCYQLADVLQCQGGDATCGTTVCTTLICPVASQPMTVKKAEYWYPSAKVAETGRSSYVSKTTRCATTETCYSTCQYDDSGIRYCVLGSEVPDDKVGIKLEGNPCP
jgi:hypothetical protein